MTKKLQHALESQNVNTGSMKISMEFVEDIAKQTNSYIVNVVFLSAPQDLAIMDMEDALK